MKRIAILGCGPAGLIAAHEVEQQGFKPLIYSVKEKSPVGGAQFLHGPIDGVSGDDSDLEILFAKVGDRHGYAAKVYGDPEAVVSFDRYRTGKIEGWSLRIAYDRLWAMYEDDIIDGRLGPDQVQELVESPIAGIFSSIPAPILCYKTEHRFKEQAIAIVPIEDDSAIQARATDSNYVLYSGSANHSWYRRSSIDGEAWAEYSLGGKFAGQRAARDQRLLDMPGAVEGTKPMGTDCNCFDGEVFRIGRFGRWDRSQLVHTVQQDVRGLLDAMHAEV